MRPHILYEVEKIVLYTVYPRYQLKGPLGEDNRSSEKIFFEKYEILCILYPFLAHFVYFIPLFGPFWGFFPLLKFWTTICILVLNTTFTEKMRQNGQGNPEILIKVEFWSRF